LHFFFCQKHPLHARSLCRHRPSASVRPLFWQSVGRFTRSRKRPRCSWVSSRNVLHVQQRLPFIRRSGSQVLSQWSGAQSMTIYAPDFLITLLGTKVKMRSSSRITACHPDEKLCIKGSVQMDQERNRTKSKPMTLDGQVTVPCTWISRETCLRVIENGCLRQLPEAITASAAY
jgi:hypothetical protein